MQIRCFAIGFALVLNAASLQPLLYPRIILPGESVGPEFWRDSPNVLIVRIQKTEMIGPKLELSSPRGFVVRLVKATAEVEGTIQGPIASKGLEFYYYTNVLSPDGPRTAMYELENGNRYVVFLRRDAGIYRTMSDVYELRIRIRSGWKKNSSFLSNDVGKRIADVLLSPEEGYEKGFSINLNHDYVAARQFAPAAYMAGLLRNLIAKENPLVREQACLALSRHFEYRDPCLPGLRGSMDSNVRRQASSLLESQQKSEVSLFKQLKEQPLKLKNLGRVEDLFDDLLLFTLDRNAEIREMACAALLRLFATEWQNIEECQASGHQGRPAR